MFIVVEPGESIVPPALPVFVQATVSPGFEGTDPTNTTEVLPSQKVALAGLIDAFVIQAGLMKRLACQKSVHFFEHREQPPVPQTGRPVQGPTPSIRSTRMRVT